MDENARADDLDRFLDELAAGNASTPLGIEPDFARIARRYRALGRAPAPSGARMRVWHRLATHVASTSISATTGSAVNGRAPKESPMLVIDRHVAGRPAKTAALTRWKPRFVPLAAAAILLAAIAAGSLTFWRGDDRPRTVPAAVVATPSPNGPVFETLFATTLPAAEFPTGDHATSGLALFTIPVGGRSTWEPTCCPGVMIEYVLEGAYAVRAEAPITVVRASGMTEKIAARTGVTLSSGDALISRNETVVETWNAGAVPVVLVNWMTVDGNEGHLVTGWQAGPNDVQHRATLPRASATITLQRITVSKGAETALDAPGGQQFALITEPNGYLIRRTDGSIRSIQADPGSSVVAYVLTVEPDVAAATPAVPSEASPTP